MRQRSAVATMRPGAGQERPTTLFRSIYSRQHHELPHNWLPGAPALQTRVAARGRRARSRRTRSAAPRGEAGAQGAPCPEGGCSLPVQGREGGKQAPQQSSQCRQNIASALWPRLNFDTQIMDCCQSCFARQLGTSLRQKAAGDAPYGEEASPRSTAEAIPTFGRLRAAV